MDNQKGKIIAGIYKGRTIYMPQDESIRPTVGRIKGSLFNIIQFQLSGAIFLDLFSGTGSIGLEALSRGACVTLVDKSPAAVALIEKNIQSLKAEKGKNLTLLCCDWRNAVERLKNETFDFIFCDPPYKEEKIYSELLSSLSPLTKPFGVIIIEHNGALNLSHQDFLLKEIRRYGTVDLHFYVKQPA